MKRLLCVCLTFMLLFGALALGEDMDFVIDDDYDFDDDIFIDDDMVIDDDSFFMDDDEKEEVLLLTEYDYDDITIGNPTPLHGQFFTEMWGNATSDTDIRYLVNGYNLIVWDSSISMFRLDHSVVNGAVITDNEAGDRTYLLVLYDDLYYSDGTRITAWDYAFSVLLQCDPVIRELDGTPGTFNFLVGYEDYVEGKKDYLEGMRVISDQILSFTVKHEELPFFFELTRFSIWPYPIDSIAPGYIVMDNGKGAYLAKEEAVMKQSPLSADLLRKTILDPETGYQSHPTPAAGPYRFLEYDGVSAKFEINPFYKGNEDGVKPRIHKITYTLSDNADMIEKLEKGDFTLLNKVTASDTILEGLLLCQENGQYTRSTYPRIGVTYIYFNALSSKVQELSVRRAIAHCYRKLDYIEKYVGSFGLEMKGLMGLGQWMYQLAVGTMTYEPDLGAGASAEDEEEYQRTLAELEKITLDTLMTYETDTDIAIQLLEEAEWTLNEQGEPFDPEKDTARCKMTEDYGLVKLSLTMGVPDEAHVEDAFAEMLKENLNAVGIELEIIPIKLEDLADNHNWHDGWNLDLMYLGDNFSIGFNPALFFESEEAQHEKPREEDQEDTTLRAVSADLHGLAVEMNHTEPRDVVGYMKKWIRFQERLAELLPIIPVYGNIYFDFYTKELHNYLIEELPTVSDAMIPARMYGLKEVEMEVELSGLDEDGNVIDPMSYLERAEGTKEEIDFSRGALSLFPQEVRDQIPPEYTVINEFVTSSVSTEDVKSIESMTIKFTFQTIYPEDSVVYALFGLKVNGVTEWFVREAYTLEDGGVSVSIENELLEKLNGNTYALVIVSEQ